MINTSVKPELKEFHAPDPRGINPLKSSSKHRISYLEWGKGKKVVICVHGLTRNAHDFDYLSETLADEGYRVLCPDIAGRGRSEWLKNPKHYGYPLYCADMLAFMEELNLKNVIWIGTSMGGLIGMFIAANHPDIIKRMVLNDIGPFIPGAALMRIGRYIGQRRIFETLDDGEDYLRKIFTSYGLTSDEHWKHLAKYSFNRVPGGGFHIAYDPAIANAFWNNRGKQRKMPDMKFWNIWDKIDIPMLITRGIESDLLLQETAEQMTEKKMVMLQEFPDIGHAPALMTRDQINTITSWVDKDKKK